MSELKKMYRTIVEDPFPQEMTIEFGGQKRIYRKRTWKIKDPATGDLIERGLRYGENPDQPAALYELVSGNLVLGGCEFIDPRNGLVSSITED
ncbi:MAG TPA: IMP cyclohydrolase, partial [Nitrospirae bacterium]|nr:IMP cyclohydrolase [Nitrospirota bacterium]